MVFVDTSVWIDFFREAPTSKVNCLEQLLNDEIDVFTTGIILQELLNGIKHKGQRSAVKDAMMRYVLIMPSFNTHIQAAEIFDGCRKKGITIRSPIDCLIAALALEYDLPILENDRDFLSISKIFPLRIIEA